MGEKMGDDIPESQAETAPVSPEESNVSSDRGSDVEKRLTELEKRVEAGFSRVERDLEEIPKALEALREEMGVPAPSAGAEPPSVVAARLHQETLAAQREKLQMKRLRASFPEVADGIDCFRPEGRSRDIAVVDGEGLPVLVETNRGAIVDESRDVLTQKVYGCGVLVVSGKGKRAMFHLTPEGSFPYRDWIDATGKVQHANGEDSAAHIAEALRGSEMNPEDCRGVFLGTLGNARKSSKFNYERQDQAWRQFAGYLQKAGFRGGSIAAKEIPLDEMAVYASGNTPDKIFVMGRAANYQAGDGSLQIANEGVQEYEIGLDGSSDSGVVIEKPPLQ